MNRTAFYARKKGGDVKTFITVMVMCLVLMPGVLSIAETYDADVTTDDGTYSASADVENGEVTSIDMPNEGYESITGGDIEGGEASGYDAEGDAIDVRIDDDSEEE